MLSSISNWVEDKATGYLRTGIQAGGTLAGNAVGGVGSLVESAGKSAASGVQGGIGGVGGYINGYGDNIKRSMSADGPASNTQKKTAVKPSPPAAPKKALPSSTGPSKALSAKPATPKPVARAPPAKPNATPKPAPGTRLPQGNKPGGPTSVKSQGPVGISKPKPASNASKLTSGVNSSGKVVVSAASRPGTKRTAVTRSTPKPMGGDILGIGDNFGDVSKTKPNNSQNKKSSGGAARKSSAGDPLALGDLANLEKKK